MDKLRKTAAWIWLYKERLIFLIMVIVLCQRVWVVLHPVEVPIGERLLTNPRSEAPPLPTPPRLPIPDIVQRHAELTNNNPFSIHGGAGSTTSGGAPKFDVKLLSVIDAGGRLRAKLKLPGESRRGEWRDLNAEFKGYTLEEIDTENKTVVVYDKNTGERHTLSQE